MIYSMMGVSLKGASLLEMAQDRLDFLKDTQKKVLDERDLTCKTLSDIAKALDEVQEAISILEEEMKAMSLVAEMKNKGCGDG